jgi:hypothetical protein
LRHVLLWLETATLEKAAVGNQHEPGSEHMPSASTNLIADT